MSEGRSACYYRSGTSEKIEKIFGRDVEENEETINNPLRFRGLNQG
jgi:hypothetical protein